MKTSPSAPPRPRWQVLLQQILLWFAIALLLSGGGGFLAGLLIDMAPDSALRHVEFPLGDPKGLCIDRDHRVYVYSGFYTRFQLYDAQGRFLGGWQRHGFKGHPRLKMDALNRLHVQAAGHHWQLEPEQGFREDTSNFDTLPDHSAPDSGLYELRDTLLFPKVVYVASEGEQIRLRSRWQTWGLIAGPLLAWLIGALGGGLLALLTKDQPAQKKI